MYMMSYSTLTYTLLFTPYHHLYLSIEWKLASYQSWFSPWTKVSKNMQLAIEPSNMISKGTALFWHFVQQGFPMCNMYCTHSMFNPRLDVQHAIIECKLTQCNITGADVPYFKVHEYHWFFLSIINEDGKITSLWEWASNLIVLCIFFLLFWYLPFYMFVNWEDS